MRFFFYGTLIDPDIRALVLGPLADRAEIVPASLPGWRVVRVQGKTYPVVARGRGAADGVLAKGLPDAALESLVAYEGPEYEVAELPVSLDGGGESLTAFVFVASPACRLSTAPWRFEEWERRHKRRFLANLRVRRPD